MLWRDTLPLSAGNGSLSASSSCEALITGASIPAVSPSGEQVQAVRNRAVLHKKRREVSADWRQRAEEDGRPYAPADLGPQRTVGVRARGSFSTSPAEGQPRRSSFARMVVGRRPGKSAATSSPSPSESSEELEPTSPVAYRTQRPDNTNPFTLYDAEEEETDEQGRLVVRFPQVNVVPGAEPSDAEDRPKRRISDIWKGLREYARTTEVGEGLHLSRTG